MKKIKLKKSDIALLTVLAATLIIYILAWLSTPFSDFYVQKVYPIYSAVPIFLSGLVPFSVGEIMVIIAISALIIGVPCVIITSIVLRRRTVLLRKVLMVILRILSWILAYIFLTETLGCFVMYHCTPFSARYFEPTEHTEELLLDTLQAVSERVAELSSEFERDADGYVLVKGDTAGECIAAMKSMSEEYTQLSGYYPRPKRILNSFFMSQEGIIGLYIPFAYEATYNRDIQPIAVPSTICHELAHLKGIIQEDEASFVGQVACFNSGNPELQYSAYLDALYYLYKNALELTGTEYEDRLWEAVSSVPAIVWEHDIASFTADYWEKNAEKEIIPTETVSAISDAFTEANLTMNGVSDGINAYNRVVELLMDYYATNGRI